MPQRPLLKTTTVLLFYLLLHTGCATSFGPNSVVQSRVLYNEALARTQSEQLLLNIVRLRYRDAPLFLQIGTLSTQFAIRTDAAANSELSISGGDSFIGPSLGYFFEERPTVTYTPLQGEEFAKKVLKPLSLEALVLLGSGGWSVERIFRIAAQEINGLGNAKTAAGPTPKEAPDYKQFRKACQLLRKLQLQNALRWQLHQEGTRTYLKLTLLKKNDQDGEIKELLNLLNLRPNDNGYIFRTAHLGPSRSDIAISTRSLLSILFFVSQAVDIPSKHEEEGLVTVTQHANESFRWSEVLGDLFRVSSSKEEPKEAWPRVKYRNYWFYIDETDLDSKSTFMLLSQLFSLQSKDFAVSEPALTLPLGG